MLCHCEGAELVPARIPIVTGGTPAPLLDKRTGKQWLCCSVCGTVQGLYSVSAIHKRTGNLCDDLDQFMTRAHAEAYCADHKQRSTSHEAFIVVANPKPVRA